MKIKAEIDVFDDTEYCEDFDGKKCKKLSEKTTYYWFCSFFKRRVGDSYSLCRKCDPCKSAYREST